MTEKFEKDEFNGQEEMSFAEMLDAYNSGTKDDICQGDRIEGKIIAVGKDQVYIDTGSKSDGVVDKADLLDENGNFLYQTGDRVKLYVVSMTESEIILSRALSGAGSLNMLEQAFHNHTPVEGRVVEVIKGGFSVDVMKKRSFCPISQIDNKYVENPEEYISSTFNFFITRFEENGRNIVVSRRDYLNEEQKEARKAFFKTVSPGDTVEGKVTKIMPFGVFVDLGGYVEGLVHISELSWTRVEKCEDVVAVNDTVLVKILSIEDNKDADRFKISLSMKQTAADPWDTAASSLKAGDQITGKIVRIAPFGAFVEIAPGLDGLVHLSELSYGRRVVKADDVVSQGERVQAVIKDIDIEKKRISLSIKDAHGDPWTGIEEKYDSGALVKGVVEKREPFGIFVSLEPGVTGLIPMSSISRSSDSAGFDRLKPGDTADVMVQEIDGENRRISLAPPDLKQSNAWKEFVPGEKKSTGTMGDILKAAMAKKKP
ncbi:MAG: 30S ribosomal protein S1 [Thermodesulfobacteriota bacterium]|nr:30S ribosomal protein S1 [Thermodesulfobacteriota bacterium]